MKKKNVVLIVLAVLLLGVFALRAEDDTGSPFIALGEKLDAIYDAVFSEGSGIAQREGYCQFFEVPRMSTEVLLVVPPGKRFVLLKMYSPNFREAISPDWSLTVDDNLFINGTINYSGWKNEYHGAGYVMGFVHDFPDRCVVVESGQTLKAIGEDVDKPLSLTLIGYFYDVE